MFNLKRHWIGDSFWALLDQALFAFSNFALNLFLARWLSQESYGAFSIAFTVFLFAGMFHSCILTEPMLVFGSGRFSGSQNSYLRTLIRIHWTRATPLAALLIAIASAAYWNTPSRDSILLLAAVCGATLHQWLIRRACYLSRRPSLAASGGLVYLISVLAGMGALRSAGHLGPLTALSTIAVASLISGAFIQFRLLGRREPDSTNPLPARQILAAHWEYGRWSIAVGAIGWISGNIAMVALPWWHGTAAAATFRAGTNLILPIQQLLAAAGPLIVPFLVRSRDRPDYRRITFTLALAFSVAPLAWTLFLATLGPALGTWLYQDNYRLDGFFLMMLGLSATFASFALVISSALRAIERPKLTLAGYSASAAFSLAAGLPLIAFAGNRGASITLTGATFASALVMALIAIKHLKPSSP